MAKTILVFGLPGSGKSTLANKIAQKLGAEHINADSVRTKFNDWDFSVEGRLRQAHRMKELSEKSKKQFVVLDFVCPLQEYREIVKANVTIWMDTIEDGRYDDTNNMFEKPETVDWHLKEFDSDKHAQEIVKSLQPFDWTKETAQVLGNYESFGDDWFMLFESSVKQIGQVAIQIRDCGDFESKRQIIIDKLSEKGYTHGNEYIVMLVPNIKHIAYRNC